MLWELLESGRKSCGDFSSAALIVNFVRVAPSAKLVGLNYLGWCNVGTHSRVLGTGTLVTKSLWSNNGPQV